jgi:HEAT repeat protein
VLKDERAIEAILQQMQSMQNPSGAVKALTAAGPMVEKPMIELLDHHNWLVRMAACQVLAEVGTEASIKPLEELEARSQGSVAEEAKKALEAINSRKE